MSALISANSIWFSFKGQGGNFSVYAFRGTEAVNTPFVFSIDLVSRSSNEDITSLLGTEALLTIPDKSGEVRHVHGLIAEFTQLHTANAFTHYNCVLVPRLWYLDKIRDHRIFQHLSVDQIIDKILQEQGFTASGYEFKLSQAYEAREYCVQYGETDLYFISRLCEEEGIYFYFEHSENAHKLCFCDHAGGPKISGEHSLRFYLGSGNVADTATVSRLELKTRVNSNAVTYREWNFEKPNLDLEVQRSESDHSKAPVPRGMKLEQYEFPHRYQLQKTGDSYAELQLLRQLSLSKWIVLESDVSRFLPGYTFSLYDHPRADVNAGWWTVAVHHMGEQPGVLEHEAPDGRGQSYSAGVEGILEQTRFVPGFQHKKNRVEALQSAIVTGPEGEEVHCDKYGRVKVQFHWDRLGQHDENATCWVRVADAWAGENFGFIQLPRIGQEVMVEFMEGDPDRPVITGRVYNELKMPPWQLPEQKTLSGIQSREFKGDKRNQLVLDDTQNQVQAQLSSDHNLSQLNLGYITRVNHHEGRTDFRGEGFELRTDGWGVMRAAKGMVLTTEQREKAQAHHKDIATPVNLLGDAAALHGEAMKQAAIHNTIETTEHEALKDALEKQHSGLKGSGETHGEISEPHLLLFSPAGIAASTPYSLHTETGEHVAVTSYGHTSFATGKNFMASAIGAVRIFAHNLGIRLFSGKGKVEIQAQDNDIELIAKKVLRLISAQDCIELTAAKEIRLNADGSYIRIGRSGIESGTTGRWIVHAASHSKTGPASQSGTFPDLPSGASQFNDGYVVRNTFTGEPVKNMQYELTLGSGKTVSGITGEDGKIPMQSGLDPDSVMIKLFGVKD
jgi:type VI secretion system secreted protein VgrG